VLVVDGGRGGREREQGHRKTTMKGSHIRPTLGGGGQVCCLPMLVGLMWRPNFLFGMIDGLPSGHG
jgi:hypothetical protein